MPPPFTKDRASITTSRQTFAVHSIRRGSQEWNALIRPFVADIVFRSLVRRRYKSEPSFRSYHCQAAVLFVDLSGYSKITSALAHRGAHVLSSVVNEYLSILLQISQKYGGDVVKFAGDAVMIVFEGGHEELGMNVICAAKCALEMQKEAGSHEVEGTDHCFRIHCGISSGPLVSEIFRAPTAENMQRLYHSLSGQTMIDIGDLVDFAKAGEVCISDECYQYIGSRGTCRRVDECENCAWLIESLDIDPTLREMMENHIEDVMSNRLDRRDRQIEEELIHPKVLRLLSHGGSSPTQIAQMRHLCVVFIGMTSRGRSTNWLMEVQGILDKKRCPIVQIIDDDKGVHVVAAINLYESIPEVSILGLEICLELQEKRVGFALGMALGSTFCGVTGSSRVACRWDITGPAAVRAARLMQYAISHNHDTIIDESVYMDQNASTRLVQVGTISIKGTKHPVNIYSLSPARNHAALRILETVHGSAHDDLVRRIQCCINDERSRCAMVVTGPPLAGKKIVCQRAAGFADLMPYLHVSEETAGMLQLGRTIATWFKYFDDEEVRSAAATVLDHLDGHRFNLCHDLCLELVDIAMHKGYKACFVVDRLQFLDKFSLSLLSECLVNQAKRSLRRRPSGSTLQPKTTEKGKMVFLCIHVNLYDFFPAKELVEVLSAGDREVSIPIVTVGQVEFDELRVMYRDMADMEVEDKLLTTFSEASGSLAGYFIERAAAMRRSLGETFQQGTRPFAEVTKSLIFHIRGGCYQRVRSIPVMNISADVAMRYAQVFDELPPLYQTLLKLLALATRKRFYRLPIQALWGALDDLIGEGVEDHEIDSALEELEDMFLVNRHLEDNTVSFLSPALADSAFVVCTPIQIRRLSTTLVERLEGLEMNPNLAMVMADLYRSSGKSDDIVMHFWRKAYHEYTQQIDSVDQQESERWLEILEEEVEAHGCEAEVIFGESYRRVVHDRERLDPRYGLLKIYASPVAFGPMGLSFNVITRNLFQEQGSFYGRPAAQIKRLRRATKSAARRYKRELQCIENFMRDHGLGLSDDLLEEEFKILREVAEPPETEEALYKKVVYVLDRYVPEYVESRRIRLIQTMRALKGRPTIEVIQSAPTALRRAYLALQSESNRNDAAQDALMILATLNWKPRPIPEQLPLLYNQTVARLRNKVLQKNDLALFKHDQSIDDLEAFLISTTLIYHAQDTGTCLCE